MVLAERHSLLEEPSVSESPTVGELLQQTDSFEVAHVGEILHDFHSVLLASDYDANMFVMQMSSTDGADLAASIPQDVRSKPRSEKAV
ncbi:MAG: hypothetical protein KBD46_03605, partial [Candidatus Levybacteria bacterium]|nr:hypothetical protein [Candidatus Levybacteria bacterium]